MQNQLLEDILVDGLRRQAWIARSRNCRKPKLDSARRDLRDGFACRQFLAGDSAPSGIDRKTGELWYCRGVLMAFVWARYLMTKVRASFADSVKKLERGEIRERDLFNTTLRKVMRERLTYKFMVKGEEMTPTFSSDGENVLVRAITSPSVSDVVMLRHPTDPSRKLVRRVAAVEGDEMLSTNDKDEPFELDEGQCWVLCDNTSISYKDAQDSRSFGPIDLGNIEGRVIYFRRSTVDHGPVLNSEEAMEEDSAVLAMELDVDELTG